MEVIAILLFVLFGVLFLKILGALFHVGIFVLTLPFKLLAFVFSGLVVFLVLIPLGVVAGLASLVVLPFALLTPLLPIALIGFAVWIFLRD